MIVHLQATAISADEIINSLTPEARNALKGKRAVAYTIAEEGVSHPRIIGEGNQKLTWPRSVIKRIAEAVKTGTKLFDRHNADSSHDGRKSIGEVVGAFTRAVGDKLQAIAVGILGEDRPDLDVCSIEADVRVNGEMVGDVDAITGIALSSSRIDSPAFVGAQRLATLQCFAEDTTRKEIAMAPTFAEVKAFIQEHNVYPRQLYTLDDIKNDRDYGPLIAKAQSVDAVNAELEQVKKDKLALEGQSAAAIRSNEEAQAKARFEKLIPAGATEKQKAFYMRRFDPKRLEKLDDAALTAHIEAEATEFAETSKLFGVAEGSSIVADKGGTAVTEKVKETSTNAVDNALAEITGGKA